MPTSIHPGGPSQLTVDQLLFALTAPRPAPAGRPISNNEACAALVTAQHLDWIAL